MIHVHRSNRSEELLHSLARVIEQPIGGPFARECIVVQDRGMERWLSLSLSRQQGVLAHTDFPFPKSLLERALRGVLAELDESTGRAFEPETAMWSLAELLSEQASRPGFEAIAGYLADDAHGDKTIGLARRIAETFDHYVVYRPEMVLAWERGEPAPGRGNHWQAELFRALIARHGSTHLAARLWRMIDALERSADGLEHFPRRVSLFGIATLPPLYLSALEALSRHVEIHLFALSPSSSYWGEIRSRREILRELRRSGRGGEDAQRDLALEEGHPLLASLGRLGRDFQQVLESRVDYEEGDEDLYRDPLDADRPSMLSVLHSDILNLRERGESDGTGVERARAWPLAPDDRSIRIHACHGPMREAEVLHDQLLDLFERDPSLEPRDVVVLTPDVETYAPFVEAAFARSESGAAGRIPCRVADRSLRSTHPVVDAFGRVLDVLGGRLPTSEVLDLLSSECIRARFGISEEGERWIRARVAESGIRWGIDAAHRAAEGQPALLENTWQFGLDRLLVGHAMGPDGNRLFAGVLPASGIEGSEASALGGFVDFCETLFAFHRRTREPRDLGDWSRLLDEVLSRMTLATGDHFHEQQRIREILEDLARIGAEAGFAGGVSLAALQGVLDSALSRMRWSGGFLAGGVTVCELVPMRTIPFRVVCLMGLHDDAFPRRRRPLGFDLVSAHPQPGDRNARDDDRQLFLEALLSARDRLVITYSGQDVRDNRSRPPSVVIGELLDHLGTAWRPAANAGRAECERFEQDPQLWIRDRIVVRHALQPFSEHYFDARDPELFSYSGAFCEAARALAGERTAPGVFLEESLPEPSKIDEVVHLDDLVDYFRQPARHLLRTRLGLELRETDDLVPEREPVELEGLPLWQVGDDLLERALELGSSAESAAALREVMKARGVLPLGTPGLCAYEEVARGVEDLAARVLGLCQGDPLPDLEIDTRIGGVQLVGRIDRLWPTGRVVHHFAKLGHGSEIDLWIRHLVLCAFAPDTHVRQSHLIGRPSESRGKSQIRLSAPDDARAKLEALLEIHRQGRTIALPLLPRSSRKYVESLLRRSAKKSPDPDPDRGASLDAYESYRGGDRGRGERDDPWVRQLFGQSEPLSPAYSPSGDPHRRDGFRSLAMRVFAPMLGAREGVS